MDGRIQLPVISFLHERFNAEFVDTITEAGPNLILAEQKNQTKIQSIFERLKISIDNHHSVGIAIVGHHDCAGNPVSKDQHLEHLSKAVDTVKSWSLPARILGLWVNERWEVEVISDTGG